MSGPSTSGDGIRRFILAQVATHPHDIANLAAARFNISRQAINKHLRRLLDDKAIVATGRTQARVYRLPPPKGWTKTYAIKPSLAEDVAWRQDIAPALGALPKNAAEIWHYACTEMFNNAIDHSEGKSIRVSVYKSTAKSEMVISDDGVGIFRKIQNALKLADERHAVLELAKGKLTTDPSRHSGEGIFFTSRVMDRFNIVSGGVKFSHRFGEEEDWVHERDTEKLGTLVRMSLANHSRRRLKKIFDQFTSDDFAFTKTVVPVRLTRYGDDQLVSRSQAKRLLARVDRFRVVVLDFAGVDSIGHSFADEIFRVFVRAHPDIGVSEVNASQQVAGMIARARAVT